VQLQGLDHVALTVRDVERSAQWYIEVLGFERQHHEMWDGVPTFVGKNETGLALFPLRKINPTQSGQPELRILHIAMRADRKNFLMAQRELRERGIEFESQDHEISHSIYFEDLDGHELEITTYELDDARPSIPKS
jgi:catechol 2,3-dioxygenase-like lactoylglutathione lyase family enzyme